MIELQCIYLIKRLVCRTQLNVSRQQSKMYRYRFTITDEKENQANSHTFKVEYCVLTD